MGLYRPGKSYHKRFYVGTEGGDAQGSRAARRFVDGVTGFGCSSRLSNETPVSRDHGKQNARVFPRRSHAGERHVINQYCGRHRKRGKSTSLSPFTVVSSRARECTSAREHPSEHPSNYLLNKQIPACPLALPTNPEWVSTARTHRSILLGESRSRGGVWLRLRGFVAHCVWGWH